MANPIKTFIEALFGRNQENEEEIKQAERLGEIVSNNAEIKTGIRSQVYIDAEKAREAANAKTKSMITISRMNTINPPPASLRREENSWMIAAGKRAMIPMRMMKEIPLPRPRSVIRSPNHITNIEPAQRRIVDEMVNQLKPTASA